MKPLNTYKFIVKTTIELDSWLRLLKAAKDYHEAENRAATAQGYVGCLCAFSNAMNCDENKEFVAGFREVINSWLHQIYSLLAEKARETGQDPELIAALLRRCDALLRRCED